MKTTPQGSRVYREVRIVRYLSAVALVGVATIATACQDLIERPVAPASPTLNVSDDGGWVVNSLADPGDGECTNNECTLREALAAAQDGDRVTFKGNLSGTIALMAGELSIDEDVSVVGPGADVITVNGQNASRVFHVGPAAPASATISGLTITGGNEPGSVGGGIRVGAGSTLAVAGSEVIDNAAIRGAGIHSAGTLAVVGTTIASNDATSGGGGIYSNGHVAVNGSTISGNTSGGAGGAIYAECNQGGFCGIIVSMRSSTITLNNAVLTGGLYLFSNDATVRNTIIAGNQTQGDPLAPGANCLGGGISSSGYTLSINGCGASHPTDVVVPFADLFTLALEPTLALNGGGVRTHALIERGLAVDAGSCPGERVDQRGFPRPYDDPLVPNALDSCDIGAFEWQPVPTKTKGPKP
jgi:CSLREA domain-containing protein